MTFREAKAKRDELDAACKKAGEAMDKYPSGPMGITPNEVKFSPEFQADRAALRRAFAELREFNRTFTKQFRSELGAERRARRL